MADDLPPPPDGYTIIGSAPPASTAGSATAPATDLPPPPAGYTVLGDGTSLSAPQPGSKGPRPVIDDPKYASTNLNIARASLAPDVNDQIKRYAQHFGAPESYFGVQNGDIVRWVPEAGAYAKVVPTIGGGTGIADKAERALGQTAAGLGPSLPAGAAMLAGAATGPSGASIPAAGVAAAGTDLLRQATDKGIARLNGDQSANPADLSSYNYLNAAGQGAINAVGQAGGLGVNKLLTSNPLGVSAADRIMAAQPQNLQKWLDLQQNANVRGVNLSAGQVTGLPSIMQNERQLGRYGETTDFVHDFANQQRNTQIPAAVRNELEQISPVAGREAQISAFRQGANDILQKEIDARSAAAAPLYEKAFASDAYSPRVQEFLDNPEIKTGLQRGMQLERLDALSEGRPFDPLSYGLDIAPDGSWVTKGTPNMRVLDAGKRGLDAMIADETDPVTGRVSQLGRSLTKLKTSYLAELDRLNPDYATARAAYGTSSDAVSAVLDGGVGFIQKMNGIDRQNMVERVFNAQNLLPEEVGRMRNKFALSGRLDDWNAGVRAFVEGRLEDAMKQTAAGQVGNVPGKLYSGLWGHERQRNVLMAALGQGDLDTARVDGMSRLMGVLQAAGRGLPEGSPTATDTLAAQKSSIGPKARLLGKALSPSTYADLGNQILDGIDSLRTPAARQKLAQYLFSDQATGDLRKLRMLPPTSQKAINASATILANAGVAATGVRRPSDFEAPVLRQQQGP